MNHILASRTVYLLILGTLLFNPMGAHPLDSVKKGYAEIQYQVGDETGKRHLILANSLEDRKVLMHAIEQFQLAADRGKGPKQVLGAKAAKMLRNLRKDRAENYYHYPNKKERIRYRGKAAAEHMRDRRGWKRLADYAADHPEQLLKEAMDGFERLIKDGYDLLKIDKNGRIELKEGPVPEYISKKFCDTEGVISLNGEKCLRNGVFNSLMSIDEIHSRESKNIRILFQEDRKEYGSLLKMCEDLYSLLKADFGDCPDQPLTLIMLSQWETFEDYCVDSGQSVYKTYRSFTDRENFVSVVCIAGGEEGDADFHEIYCCALHELVHLFLYCINQVVMPDWYQEGIAETYGGHGTFVCKGSRTRFKGALDGSRIERLRALGGALDLEAFFFTPQITSDREATERFYTQAWAFYQYLNDGATSKIKKKFKGWEEECYSKALDETAAQELLHAKFVKDLPAMEEGFFAYLKKL